MGARPRELLGSYAIHIYSLRFVALTLTLFSFFITSYGLPLLFAALLLHIFSGIRYQSRFPMLTTNLHLQTRLGFRFDNILSPHVLRKQSLECRTGTTLSEFVNTQRLFKEKTRPTKGHPSGYPYFTLSFQQFNF